MNMASIDTNILKQMIQAGVQIIAYKTDPGSTWIAVIGHQDVNTESTKYWPVTEVFADQPVAYDEKDQCYKMHWMGKPMYLLRFSDGWEWSHEEGLYNPIKVTVEQGKVLPAGEKYYKVFHCHGCQTCWEMDETGENIIQHPHILSQEDVTDAIKELVKTSKELAAIAVASKVVIDSFGVKP